VLKIKGCPGKKATVKKALEKEGEGKSTQKVGFNFEMKRGVAKIEQLHEKKQQGNPRNGNDEGLERHH